jgi:CHAD domain-containing protein
MRVASRRLRAAVRVFYAAFGRRLSGFRRDLPPITRALGAVRDIDVLMPKIEGAARDLSAAALQQMAVLHDYLLLKRASRRGALMRQFAGQRYQRLCRQLAGFIERGPAKRSRLAGARLLVCQAAPPLVIKRLKRTLLHGREILSAPTPEGLHALRIRFKRLRYTIEFFAPAFGPDLAIYIERIVELQDLLGEHQDQQVALMIYGEFIASKAARKALPASMATIGELSGMARQKALELRAAFKEAFAGFDDKGARLRLAEILGHVDVEP